MAVEKGSFAEQAINDALSRPGIPRDDRALMTELVYGVTRNRTYLDSVITRFLNNPSKKISAALRAILRMGIYQLLFLDRIPARAVVHESTLQTHRILGQTMVGLVNGLLRKVSLNTEILIKEPGNDESELSEYYSHPKWLVQTWLDEFGERGTADILKFNNSRPTLTLRVNTNKISFDGFVPRLRSQNIRLGREFPHYNSVEILGLSQPVSSIDGFSEGLFLIQDLASQIIPGLLKNQRDHRILDACVAPGNKAFLVGSTLNQQGEIIGCDISPTRLGEARKNLDRLGMTNIQLLCADCSDQSFADSLGTFDRILVDAPCSSLGVLRHNPEVKYGLTREHLSQHSQKQLQILRAVSRIVRPGGMIVYSVCSTSREETLDVVRSFLSGSTSFAVDPINQDSVDPHVRVDKDGFLETFPPSSDFPMDGFFAARFRRI
jgi:16S rRNA (cytosine967-C5)-methyltransferase